MKEIKSIGVGVTSYLRPDHIELFKRQIEKHSPKGLELYVAYDDFKREGIAKRKNECLRALKHCDYIFLFDDDCIVIKPGWIDFFIEAHKASGQHHFNYLVETPTIQKIKQIPGNDDTVLTGRIDVYNNTGGVFMFLTKEVIEKVGAFGEYPAVYGMEHAAYTKRIHAAGLTPYGEYLCPFGADQYLYSLDYQNHLPFNRAVNHMPSMVGEMGKIAGYIKQNQAAFEKDLQEIYKPL